jgi:5,10-methylenetetrahydromethanopterin reductase
MTGTGPHYSCAFPPSADIVDKAGLAERLGYHRVWVFESPAHYGDMWVALARIAQATERIGFAAGVAIPGLRHPMVTASAIGSVHELAPGRLLAAFGTGYTGRSTLGQKPVPWTKLARYVQEVRALLRGEMVEIDGQPCQMMHLPGFAPERPVDVPLWVAASGPKGFGMAQDLHVPGILVTGIPEEDNRGWTNCALLRFGTVLEPGEDHTSPRVIEAAGPGYASTAHAIWEYGRTSVDALPGGAQWRATLEAERPATERHLVAHQGHLSSLTDRDRELVAAAGPSVLQAGWTGNAASIRERLDQASAAGITEIVYVPAGPNTNRELEAFAAVASS